MIYLSYECKGVYNYDIMDVKFEFYLKILDFMPAHGDKIDELHSLCRRIACGGLYETSDLIHCVHNNFQVTLSCVTKG